MTNAYINIQDINSLEFVLSHLKTINTPEKIAVWLDWDDTIINSYTDEIIEPEITRQLFDYMIKNRIFFSIITGRFNNTACDDKKRNIFTMQHNIINTIFPVLEKLGLDIDRYKHDTYRNSIYKVFNNKNKCIGILYMGIFFSERKGETIKHYSRQMNLNKKYNIFVDDYEPYLIDTTVSLPSIVAYRRNY